MKNEIVLFEEDNIKLEVNVENETVWLTQKQISELFDKNRKTITRHIQNIYKELELEENTVCSKKEHTAKDGKKYVVQLYNLDMIISVGYRVKSKRGILFRKWANKILKEYLLTGYAINNKRLEYLEKTIKLIDIANRNPENIQNEEAKDILKIINNFSKAFSLLDKYDYNTLTKPKGKNNDKVISYEECLKIIASLKLKENSRIFALERNNGLESILKDIYCSFDGVDVYPSIEEKGANLLYIIVKNHVFIDGNKRIAATIFIYFLQFYNILQKNNELAIDNNTLVTLTLLIAQSDPKEKDIIIDLILNFLHFED